MALFKISRGLKEKLPTTKTSGHCWYTIDDSMFYIDYEDENGEVQRQALNAQDAQTLTGASLSTILNSSDIEIPTSKTVLDALSTKVSFAESQSLTDEQRAQVRKNIAEFPCDWHEVTGYSVPATGVHVLSSIGTPYNTRVFDIEAMTGLTSAVLTQYSAIGCLHGCVKVLWNNQNSSRNNVSTWMNRIVTDFEVIQNAGLIEDKLWITVKEIFTDSIDYSYCVSAYNTSTATHQVQFYDRHHVDAGVISYNKDTGVASINMRANSFTDETLTKTDYAADAKAVGDALALKADKTEIVQSDWSQTDETATDYIKNKPDEADALALAMDMNLISPVSADDGSIYTDENGALYSL